MDTSNIYLEVTGEPNLLARPDEPLSRVILVPSDRIPVVHRELVMEVVVTFTDRYQGSNEMISRCMLIIEWRLSEPMCQRVHAEC